MVGPVVDDLGEAHADRGAEHPPAVALHDLAVGILLTLDDLGPGGAIGRHRGTDLGEAQLRRLVIGQGRAIGEEREVPAIGLHEVLERLEDRSVGARGSGGELLRRQCGADVDELLGRPGMVGERVVED